MKQYKHDWQVSFTPMGDQIYLTAYCPNCRNAATARVLRHSVDSSESRWTHVDLPPYGCVAATSDDGTE